MLTEPLFGHHDDPSRDRHRADAPGRPVPPALVDTVDCDRCPVRGTGCGDCVVALFLDERPDADGVPLDARESAAVHAFRVAGLVSEREADRARARRTTAVLSAV